MLLQVGQQVKVGAHVGVIMKVSTWAEVNGPPAEAIPCYYVRCPAWDQYAGGGRWVSAANVEPVGETISDANSK